MRQTGQRAPTPSHRKVRVQSASREEGIGFSRGIGAQRTSFPVSPNAQHFVFVFSRTGPWHARHSFHTVHQPPPLTTNTIEAPSTVL